MGVLNLWKSATQGIRKWSLNRAEAAWEQSRGLREAAQAAAKPDQKVIDDLVKKEADLQAIYLAKKNPSLGRRAVHVAVDHPVSTTAVAGSGVLIADSVLNDGNIRGAVVTKGAELSGKAVTSATGYVADKVEEKVRERAGLPPREEDKPAAGDNAPSDDPNNPDGSKPKDQNGMFGNLIETGLQAFGLETNDENGKDKPWVETAKDLIPSLLGLGAAAGTAYFADGKVKWLAVAAAVVMAFVTGKKLVNSFNGAANPDAAPAQVTGGPQVDFVNQPEPVVTAPNAAPKPS